METAVAAATPSEPWPPAAVAPLRLFRVKEPARATGRAPARGQGALALASRVVIERAIGMLAERFDLSVIQAFELLRSAARASRRQVRSLAEEITERLRMTPSEVADARRRGQSA